MIKKIKIDQLRPGMYIDNFDCGWMRHPFLTNSMKVPDDKTIEKIISHGFREVYIDSEKGPDVSDAPTKDEVRQELHSRMEHVVKTTAVYRDTVPVQEEIIRAKKIKNDAKHTVRNLMEDVRLGKQLQVEKVEPLAERLVDSVLRNNAALISLSRIKKKDDYTFTHSVSVGVLLIAFGRQLGYDQGLIKLIGIGGLLHDVGKIHVPDSILTKKSALTEDELIEVRKHVEKGRTILEESKGLDETSIHTAVHHHERMDGTGYPSSLKGDGISTFGQMSAIVDVYDAITADRCYQKKMLPTEALRKMYEWSEYHYNRDLVEHFIRCVGIYPVGTLVRLKNDMLGVVLKHGEHLLQPVVRIIYDVKKQSLLRYYYDIDLAHCGDGEQISRHENPDNFDIVPDVYL